MDSSNIDTATAKSYLDFSGLGELRAKAQQNQGKALKETSQQFEGLFIQMMMKSMRDASEPLKDEENESSARATFEDMFDREVSVQMSKRSSMGVAGFLERAIQQQTPVAADVLKARQQKGMPLQTPLPAMPLQSTPQQGLPLEKPHIKSLQEIKAMPTPRSDS